MPIHDWSRVPAEVFHHFHHSWVEEIQRALNAGVLPPDYYAMAEQDAAGVGPDVLTLQGSQHNGESAATAAGSPGRADPGGSSVVLAKPRLAATGETDMAHYRRKRSLVTVRHVSGDRVVAIIEIVSPGNKNSQNAIDAFVRKAAELLDQGVHLLILDLLPPGPRDPDGLHALIWKYIVDETPPKPDRPLSLMAYETTEAATRAYVVPVAVGDQLTEMPLFLEPGGCVHVPLEATYQAAVAVFPRRWRHLLQEQGPT